MDRPRWRVLLASKREVNEIGLIWQCKKSYCYCAVGDFDIDAGDSKLFAMQMRLFFLIGFG